MAPPINTPKLLLREEEERLEPLENEELELLDSGELAIEEAIELLDVTVIVEEVTMTNELELEESLDVNEDANDESASELDAGELSLDEDTAMLLDELETTGKPLAASDLVPSPPPQADKSKEAVKIKGIGATKFNFPQCKRIKNPYPKQSQPACGCDLQVTMRFIAKRRPWRAWKVYREAEGVNIRITP